MQRQKTYFVLFLIFAACGSDGPEPFSHYTEPVTQMKFVLLPGGSFYMGNPSANPDSLNSEIRHLVTLTKDFWIASTEVTREEWQKVMGDEELHPGKPSPFTNDNPHYPVVCKSYYDVQNFLRRLGKLSPGNRFRLPTEAEWEYACRAGTSTNFSTGTHISDSFGNFNAKIPSAFAATGRYIGHPTPVGSYPPNPWGLYDMHGNVWEWVDDWFAPYSPNKTINPQGPPEGTLKLIRGGSWYFGADNARSCSRRTHEPGDWGYSIGFRIVCIKDS